MNKAEIIPQLLVFELPLNFRITVDRDGYLRLVGAYEHWCRLKSNQPKYIEDVPFLDGELGFDLHRYERESAQGSSCALCHRYLTGPKAAGKSEGLLRAHPCQEHPDHDPNACCPIKKVTGCSNCYNTPWSQAADAYEDLRQGHKLSDYQEQALENQVRFLKAIVDNCQVID